MKKIFKRILYGFLIFIGILVLLAGYFGFRFWYGTRDMTPAETQKINDSVFVAKDKFVNAYFFKTRQGYVMVDAGVNEKNFRVQMDKLGIQPDEVTTILLTHTDSDHTGAMGLFKNAKVYMHMDEEQMVNGKNGKFFFLRVHWKYSPYTLLNDRDTLNIGGLRIQIIHTPGHTPGSCCYLFNHEYLATGDNVAYKNGKFMHFTDFFNMDTQAQESALKNLPELNSTPVILMAHYGIVRQKTSVVSVDIKKMENAYFLVTIDLTGISHKEMGRMYGEKIRQVMPSYDTVMDAMMKDQFDMLKQAGLTFDIVKNRAIALEQQVKPEYRDEIEGMASLFPGTKDEQGDGVFSRNEFLVWQFYTDVVRPTQCSASAAFADASSSGYTIVGRNLDWYALKDNSLAKIHSITLIHNGSKSIACINFLGQLTPVSGFNDHHLFGAILDCETGAAYPQVQGKRSYHFDLRYGLENDSTIDGLANFMKDKDYTFNHLIFLADEHSAGVLEDNIGSKARSLRTTSSMVRSGSEWGIPNTFATVNDNRLPGNFVQNPESQSNLKRWTSLKSQYSSRLKSGKIDIEKMKLIVGYPSSDGNAKSSGALFRSNDHAPTLQSIVLKMDTYELWVAFAPQGKLPMKPAYLQVFGGDPFLQN
ncbi:MAG: C45 family autoproteolytic acyltransferase/hydrolase [Bacteroidetes bacterium]|nr:C45 family autoproteolytic acyltransferase/hydrolase [Bacteroidota bacterium]